MIKVINVTPEERDALGQLNTACCTYTSHPGGTRIDFDEQKWISGLRDLFGDEVASIRTRHGPMPIKVIWDGPITERISNIDA